MMYFTYTAETDCLMLKDENDNLIDHKFYNHFKISLMKAQEFLHMLAEDCKTIAQKHNIKTYIYNFMKE